MSAYTRYRCNITDKLFNQKSGIKDHLKSLKYKQAEEIFRLKLDKLKKKELRKRYGTSNIDKIVKKERYIKIDTIEILSSEEEPKISISSKESMKDAIHDIHNFLRNNGAGYGMNALKLFTLFYGLAKIEQNGHFEKTGLSENCRFSNIKKEFKINKEIGMDYLENKVMVSIYENEKINKMLAFEINYNITPNIISILLNKINQLVKKEKEIGFQLAGKIYEYFIGRDQTAISELGAYFTDRHITDYIYENIFLPEVQEGKIPIMSDPFGGSGGFTLGYITHLKNKYSAIDWKNQLKNIYHFDMNSDVVKYAMLEIYCLTGEFPDTTHLRTQNSFKDNFQNEKGNIKFDCIFTNPPYGGDKIIKSESVEHLELIKKMCEEYLKTKYKLRNMKQILKVKDKLDEKDLIKLNQYEVSYKKLNNIKKENEMKIVSLNNSSARFQLYAKENGIDISKCKDKESVSFLMMMDLLEEKGTAVGVLKEGIFFDNKYKHLRKYCVENFNVETIVSIDASQFENTSTKTSIIKFSNTGKTKKIKFYELVVEKDETTQCIEQEDGSFKIEKIKGRITGVSDKLVSQATYKEILENDYTFNNKKYNKKKLLSGDGYEMVKLGDIVEFLPKSKRKASFGKDEGEFNFYTSSDKVKKCDVVDYDDECLVIGTGGNSCIHYNIGKFSCSGDTILLKYKNNIEFNYIMLKCIWNYLLNEMNGSTIKHVTKSLLENLEIPIPKSSKKIKYWVDKINKPYNKIQESKEKLNELEDKVQKDIQKMLEHNETEEVELGELCEYIKTGKNIHNRTGKKYPYYGTSKIICYLDEYLFCGKHISIARKGDCIINYYNNKFTVNDDVILLKPNLINYLYLYYYLINNKQKFQYSGSTVKGVKKSDIEKLKLTLPKERKLINNLNQLFKEIDELNEEISKQEKLYQQYLDNLKVEAIQNN